MAYNAVPTVTTGDSWSAANHNTYIRDNFAAGVPDIFTAAGEIPYGTAANTASVLSLGSVGTVLMPSSDGDAPEWGSFVYARQGGSSSDWTVGATASSVYSGTSDNYVPAAAMIQVGVASITLTNPNYGVSTVNFPKKFAENPLVFVSVKDNQQYVFVDTITTSSCKVGVGDYEGTMSGPQYVSWLAIGSA